MHVQLSNKSDMNKQSNQRRNKGSIIYRTIGYIENEFNEPQAAEQISSAESKIIIDPALVEGLQSLTAGQRIMVIFHFHRSQGYELLQHPRGDKNRPLQGVFTLRSPCRPNPLGVTVVELISLDGNTLRVRGLDAINGTPLIDLKPV